MKKFVVIYRVPVEIMKKWRESTSPEEMKAQDVKIRDGMIAWMTKNDKALVDKGLPLGKNTRMTALEGKKTKAEPFTNDLNAFNVVEAESLEHVIEMYKENPQMDIPGALLDIMEVPEMHIV